jgi:hypothetical protein
MYLIIFFAVLLSNIKAKSAPLEGMLLFRSKRESRQESAFGLEFNRFSGEKVAYEADLLPYGKMCN